MAQPHCTGVQGCVRVHLAQGGNQRNCIGHQVDILQTIDSRQAGHCVARTQNSIARGLCANIKQRSAKSIATENLQSKLAAPLSYCMDQHCIAVPKSDACRPHTS